MSHLLLSNDDGVHAPGLSALKRALGHAGFQLSVIAPDRDRSGASNSLTLDRPLHPVAVDDGSYCLNGTPTDCVHLGVTSLFSGQCERVISGINSGANLGDDIIYSGTVAAAMEGRFLDKTPIAVSLVGKRHFDTAAAVIVDLLPRVEQLQLPEHAILNINVPDVPLERIKGVRVTRLGHRNQADNPVLATNPRGKECYWIAAAGDVADDSEGTDFHAVDQGFVSVTPVQLDMTYHSMIEQVKTVFTKE